MMPKCLVWSVILVLELTHNTEIAQINRLQKNYLIYINAHIPFTPTT